MRLLEAVLVPRGYEVISATDGARALELVASAKPDLVMLDVVMPQPDGYAVHDRERDETAMLPVDDDHGQHVGEDGGDSGRQDK